MPPRVYVREKLQYPIVFKLIFIIITFLSKLLITTNALARGVDVPAVAVVVNFNLPVKRTGSKTVADAETYLHRIGRCGNITLSKKSFLLQ
jgi:superfamily II DNA/RNA helicase